MIIINHVVQMDRCVDKDKIERVCRCACVRTCMRACVCACVCVWTVHKIHQHT